MGYLQKTNLGLANTDSISISTWFNYSALLEPSAPNYPRDFLFQWFLQSPATMNWIFLNPTGYLAATLSGQVGGSLVSMAVPFSPVANTWYHLFFSCALNDEAINTYINLVDMITPNLPDAVDGLGNAVDYTMKINNGNFGHPLMDTASNPLNTGHSKARFAYTMVWFGTYIEPSPTNLSKFVKVVQSKGKPADTTGKLAIAAFGRPSFFFRGGKSNYATNRGNAGAVTKLGTLADYSPGP